MIAGFRWATHAAAVFVAFALSSTASVKGPAPGPIAKLKELHLNTELVRDGRPRATVIVPASGRYDRLAARITAEARRLTGADLPIAKDSAAVASVPLRGNVIALGNRSTNALIGRLYERFYTLLDLRYPGPGGHVARTLHNPFGNGCNAILAGGSDDAGVANAVDVLIARLRAAAKGKSIRLGRLAEIKLNPRHKVPRDIKDVKIWDASAGYRSVGYFGWNSISKRMALYYMTGDPFHAKEFLRLAFPDAKAKREIAAVDGERIEDKDRPLSGPYHYNAHMMILFWDLIEESPVFTDADRLGVTNAFREQINHWAGEWAYAGRSKKSPVAVGSRHGQWAAISLYCLGRYFNTHYPAPVWKQAVEAGLRHFSPLHHHAWISGESDNLFWYNTGVAPILTYLMLTGDRVPLRNGVLGTLLRGQEALISGRRPDWALRSASVGYLHKTAHLTRDGRWLTYRNRTGVDTDVFRVGQSYWPDVALKAAPPQDLAGTWTVHRLPEAKWKARRSGLKHNESFEFASFRSRPDAGGDFVLIDGFNGASRNPYHAFGILELRLAGHTLLRGYMNQLITRVDGLMEPKIAMDAALKECGVRGETAFAVADVPDAAYANWRRTIAQRIGQYALIVDELTFRRDSVNAEVRLEWRTERGATCVAPGVITFPASREHPDRRTDRGGVICTADPLRTTGRGTRWSMIWTGPVEKGQRKTFFTLVGIQPGAVRPALACFRRTANSCVIALPKGAVTTAVAAGRQGPPAVNEAAKEVLARVRAARDAAVARRNKRVRPAAPDWPAAGTARVGGPVADLATIPGQGGPVLAAAAGTSVHLLGVDAKRGKTLATDGPVRMLRWWPDARLLLAGCADEKVIAFDPDDEWRRKWVFVSKMDPAVLRAAKTYWFKSAPGHEGIHGLHTGRFIDGKPQAFVGSACTLEILNPAGKLVRRLPVFWGKNSTFALVDGPGGTKNLLVSRKYNGTNNVSIINSKELNARRRGFIAVPPGHTYMPGWSSMNRHHLFHEDLDGDGKREVVSEINGTWNRVVVWSMEGKPLHAANFGPGPRIPRRTMRDVDVFDLDGDGRKEIVAATSCGLVVALDCRCRKRWAVRLPSAARVLACVRLKNEKEGRAVLGCDDGRVRVLDARGKLLRLGQVDGRPTVIRALADANGDALLAIGTWTGSVSMFRLGGSPGR